MVLYDTEQLHFRIIRDSSRLEIKQVRLKCKKGSEAGRVSFQSDLTPCASFTVPSFSLRYVEIKIRSMQHPSQTHPHVPASLCHLESEQPEGTLRGRGRFRMRLSHTPPPCLSLLFHTHAALNRRWSRPQEACRHSGTGRPAKTQCCARVTWCVGKRCTKEESED